MGETCVCGRPRVEWPALGQRDDLHCVWVLGTPPSSCAMVHAAYRRGIAEGVKLAKEYAFASVGYQHGEPSAHIEWHEVDAEVSAAKGS